MKFNYLLFGYIFKDFFKYILSDKSEFFKVKLSKIKTSLIQPAC